MNRTVSRRTFASATAATLASIAIIPSPAKAAQFEYKFGCNTPVDHPESVRNVAMWNQIKNETGGRLEVKVFPASQLGSDVAMLSQLRSGALQFFTMAGAQLSALVPIAGIEGVGFAFKTARDAFNTFDGPLGAYVRQGIEAKDLVVVSDRVWNVGIRQVTSSKKAIAVPSDLEGMKIRTPAGAAWISLFQALGASPTTIDIGEAYTAMQTHIVDGQENPPAVIETQRFYEVQTYLSRTNHMWSGKWYMANPEAWKALPADIQAIVKKNVDATALLEREDTEKLNESLYAKLGQQGMKINDVTQAPFRAKLSAYYTYWKGQYGATAWDMLEAKVGKLG